MVRSSLLVALATATTASLALETCGQAQYDPTQVRLPLPPKPSIPNIRLVHLPRLHHPLSHSRRGAPLPLLRRLLLQVPIHLHPPARLRALPPPAPPPRHPLLPLRLQPRPPRPPRRARHRLRPAPAPRRAHGLVLPGRRRRRVRVARQRHGVCLVQRPAEHEYHGARRAAGVFWTGGGGWVYAGA